MNLLSALIAYLLDPALWLGAYLGAKFSPKNSFSKKFIFSLIGSLIASVLTVITLGLSFNPIRIIASIIMAGVCAKYVNKKPKQADDDA